MSATVSAVPDRRRVLVVTSGLLLVMLLASLDQTIVSTALPTIVGDLGGLEHISWVVTAYLLAITAVTPLYGKLGDLYGRKVVLQGALVLFLVGSALCGLAQGMTELIVFRAIQGLGGGGLMVSAQAAIGDVVAPSQRGRYSGLFGAVFGVSSVAGPLIGGFLTTHVSWRAIFYVNLPLGALALVVLAITLPSATERRKHEIDYAGTALLALGLSALILATTLGGNTFDWASPEIVGMGLVCVRLADRSGLRRAARGRADPAAVAVSQPRVRGLRGGQPRRRLRALRLADLPAALPAGRARAEPDGVGAAADPGDGRAADLLDRVGPGHLAHGPLQGVADRRHRGRRARPVAVVVLGRDDRQRRGRAAHAGPRPRAGDGHASAGPCRPELGLLRAARRGDLGRDALSVDRRLAGHRRAGRDLHRPAEQRAGRQAAVGAPAA